MNCNARYLLTYLDWLTHLALIALISSGTAYGEFVSPLAGSWAIVEGYHETADGRQQVVELPPVEKAEVVINPDGTFCRASSMIAHARMVNLRAAGDQVKIDEQGLVEVIRSSYTAQRSQIEIAFRHQEIEYKFEYSATLQSDGTLAVRSVGPGMGGPMVTYLTLRRIAADPLCTPPGLLHEWSLEAPFAVAISSDSTRIAAADLTGRVIVLWDANTGQELQRFAGHTNDVIAVALSRDGTFLASGSRPKYGRSSSDYALRIWDARTGEELHRIEAFAAVRSLQFSADGATLLAAGAPNQRVAPDQRAAGGLWDCATGVRVCSLASPTFVMLATLRSNGDALLVHFSVAGFRSDCMQLIDTTTCEQRLRFGGDINHFDDLATSPDGQRFVTCSQDRILREWNLATGEIIRQIEIEPSLGYASCVAYLPDGKHIVADVLWDDKIRVFDLQTGSVVHIYAGHRNDVRDLAVSPDGRFLVSCSSEDGSVRVWDLSAIKLTQ